jgi:hypothetical protein
MRRFLSLAAVLALAACGGGGGGSAPSNPPPPTTAPNQGPLVTPQFLISFPARTKSQKGRAPQRVGSTAQSVTITRTTPAAPSPSSTTAPISPATCPCTISGPPSPPGVSNTFVVTTYHNTDGTGNNLDTGTATFTPQVGQNNVVMLTLNGIPGIIVIGALPTNYHAGSAGATQSTALSVDVQDLDGTTIDTTGTTPNSVYQNTVTITDPDAETYGTSLTGTPCTANVCTLHNSTEAAGITFNYKGLAENTVTIASSGTSLSSAGTASFTPLLNNIVWNSGPSSLYTGSSPAAPVNQGCGVATACGIDLYNTTGTGSTGTEKYTEVGYTDSPYNKALTVTNTSSCSNFATVAAGANDTTTGTPMTATSQTPFTAGVCVVTVDDGLSPAHTKPSFVVTYTTSQVTGQSKRRQ